MDIKGAFEQSLNKPITDLTLTEPWEKNPPSKKRSDRKHQTEKQSNKSQTPYSTEKKSSVEKLWQPQFYGTEEYTYPVTSTVLNNCTKNEREPETQKAIETFMSKFYAKGHHEKNWRHKIRVYYCDVCHAIFRQMNYLRNHFETGKHQKMVRTKGRRNTDPADETVPTTFVIDLN